MPNFIVATSDFLTFNIADFQQGIDGGGDQNISDEPDPNRFYLEYLAMVTGVNQNFVDMSVEALEMMAAGYKTGLPLTINHAKGLWDTALGIGQTVDAIVNQGKLYLQMYIAKGKTYNTMMIGSSEELIDAIKDGYIRRGSTSIQIIEAECSVCSSPIESMYGCEEHPKGRKMIVQNDQAEDEVVIPHIIVKKASAIEFSITMLRADENSEVTRKNLNFYTDTILDNSMFSEHFSGQIITNQPTPVIPKIPEGEREVTPEEKAALEAQLAAEKARADANQVTIDSQKTLIDAQKAELETLREEKVANAQLISDGKNARKEFEDAYMKEWVAFEGDAATPEAEEAKRSDLSDFTLDSIKRRTERLAKENAELYPEGRELEDNDGETENQASRFVDPD